MWKLKRIIKHWYQRRTRGFDDSELWSLTHTVFEFTLPRLKAFRDFTYSYPPGLGSHQNWKESIDQMIESIELWLKEDGHLTGQEQEKFIKGYKLFHKYLLDLWS